MTHRKWPPKKPARPIIPLPPSPDQGPPLPKWLLEQNAFLRNTSYEIWIRFWPFASDPIRVINDITEDPQIRSKFWELIVSEKSQAERALEWQEWVQELYEQGLLAKDERDSLLQLKP